MKLSNENEHLFLNKSSLKLCVLLGSINGANIPLKDEGTFSFTYLYIKVEALCLWISDNLSIPSLENNGFLCCEYPLSDKVRIAFFWS